MENQSSGQPVSKWVYVFILAIVLSVTGLAFWFSRTPAESASDTVTPTPALSALPTTEPTSTPAPTDLPTPTTKPSSTPKPTIKPTATPTPTLTPTPTPNIQTLTVTSTAALDGFRSNNGGGNNTLEIKAGRNSNLITRGFVSFETPTATLSGKTIDSVKLRLYQYQVVGNPYPPGGDLIVDSLDYGSELADDDYSRAAISSNIAIVTKDAVYEWKETDVTNAFKADIAAGHSRSQYRIRFTTETVGGDVTGDFASFYSSNSGTNTNPPQLLIRYH
jgi:hypothetical protein